MNETAAEPEFRWVGKPSPGAFLIFYLLNISGIAALCFMSPFISRQWLNYVCEPLALTENHILRSLPIGLILAIPFILLLLRKILWNAMSSYEFTADSVRLILGHIIRHEYYYQLSDFNKIAFKQNLIDIMFGTGTLILEGRDDLRLSLAGIKGVQSLIAEMRPALTAAAPAAPIEKEVEPGEIPKSSFPSETPPGIDMTVSRDETLELSDKRIGKYQIIRELGRGAVGRVVLAEDPVLNRQVAIKTLIAGEDASEDTIKRFMHEAKAAAALNHPGIVAVHEVGQERAIHYMVMDYIDGIMLTDLINSGNLTFRRSAEIARDTAEILQYAHENGIIHRDIKPANIMITADNKVHLMDFGLARIVQGDTSLTKTGQVMGTPAYINPEQAQGDTKQVDARSDIYSLGAVFYEMLTGTTAVTGETLASIFYQVLKENPRLPRELKPNLPLELQQICMMCLSRSPVDRFQSSKALVTALDEYLTLTGKDITASERGTGKITVLLGLILIPVVIDVVFKVPVFRNLFTLIRQLLDK